MQNKKIFLAGLCLVSAMFFGKIVQAIHVDHAINECQAYLNQINKQYELNLTQDEKNSLIAATKRFIQNKAQNSTICADKLREIKKEIKKHCQWTYPEKFKNSHTKRTTLRKTSSKSIRAHNKTRHPIGRYSNSRKDLELRIPMEKANHLVRARLKKEIKNHADSKPIYDEIMAKIKRTQKRKGLVSVHRVNEITQQEIVRFKKLQKKFSHNTDRSIALALAQMNTQ